MRHVVREVELWVVLPHRSTELEGYEANSLAIPRDQVELRRDQTHEVVERRRGTVEEREPGDVHVRHVVLEVEELGIERAQSFHGPPFSARFGSEWQGPQP